MYIFQGVVDQKPKRKRAANDDQSSESAADERDIDLRAWRLHFKKTLEWMGRQVGSDKKNLSEIETRPDANGPKIRNRWAPAYARALGISVDRMKRRPDEPESLGERVEAASPAMQRLIRDILEMTPPDQA